MIVRIVATSPQSGGKYHLGSSAIDRLSVVVTGPETRELHWKGEPFAWCRRGFWQYRNLPANIYFDLRLERD